MPDHPISPENSDTTATASIWLARRDRGLTAAEQDEFLQWLREDPRHGQALKKLERTWNALDVLTEWRPEHSRQPNPDLLVPSRGFWRRHAFAVLGAGIVTLAAAAALMMGLFVSPAAPSADGTIPATAVATAAAVRVIPPPERIVLADGSAIELNHDGRIETAFSAEQRRVRLVRGEAYFTVTKDEQRPFVVEAGGVAVQAIGTAFNVRRDGSAVEILVTEGLVHVERASVASETDGSRPVSARPPTSVAAGQRTRMETRAGADAPAIEVVGAREIERMLSWQGVRLAFEELPLSEVVAEFNLRNRRQLVIGDPAIAGLRVGGTFRADNVEAFARLLELSFGVTVEPRADGAFLLRRAP